MNAWLYVIDSSKGAKLLLDGRQVAMAIRRIEHACKSCTSCSGAAIWMTGQESRPCSRPQSIEDAVGG